MRKWIKIIIGVIVLIVLLLIIDMVFIFTFNKPLFAIKEDNGDSVNLVYKGLLYDTYICHEYSVPQIKIKRAKFTCTYLDIKDNKESTYVPTDLENVSISISDISLTGAVIVIKDTNRDPYTYGEWYKIEKEVDGKWYELETIIDNYGFNEIGYIPDKNNEVKFVIDWGTLYGELPIGSYRILKLANDKVISIEFGITDVSNEKIEVVKSGDHNNIKFNKYLEVDNRSAYLKGNIEDVYYTDSDLKMSLKDFVTKSYQTLDDSIKHLTDLMEYSTSYDDGGTEVYKDYQYDITIVKCNTILGNKDIFIGDYSMEFDSDSMCV